MSRCPECNSYSELKHSIPNCLVCPTCRCIFRSDEEEKKEMPSQELMQQINYLQTAILEIGKTNVNLMTQIKQNRKSIQTLKGLINNG